MDWKKNLTQSRNGAKNTKNTSYGSSCNGASDR
jgi:hypothetical protein